MESFIFYVKNLKFWQKYSNWLFVLLQEEASKLDMRWLQVDSSIALPEEQVIWLKTLANEKEANFQLHFICKASRLLKSYPAVKKHCNVNYRTVLNS